jgi:hypothetical protein
MRRCIQDEEATGICNIYLYLYCAYQCDRLCKYSHHHATILRSKCYVNKYHNLYWLLSPQMAGISLISVIACHVLSVHHAILFFGLDQLSYYYCQFCCIKLWLSNSLLAAYWFKYNYCDIWILHQLTLIMLILNN